jgi:putative ABC transport system permease protein
VFMFNSMIRSLRFLTRSRRFVVMSTLTMAAGVAASTSLFSVADRIFIRPLPFPAAHRLFLIREEKGGVSGLVPAISPANFTDIRDTAKAFDLTGAYMEIPNKILTGADQPEYLKGAAVSYGFFDVLQAPFSVGGTFSADFDVAAGEPVVVISYGLWVRQFKRDPTLLNHIIKLEDRPWRVVGVTAPGFEYPQGADFWIPLAQEAGDLLQMRDAGFFWAIARTRPGISAREAQNEVDVIGARLAQSYPTTNSNSRFRLVPFRDFLVGASGSQILVLLGAALLLLMISCANVSCLFLGRAFERRRELAVRVALGAARAQIAQDLLWEAFVIAALGAGLGLAAASPLVQLAKWLVPRDFPGGASISLNWSSFAFAAGSAGLCAVFFVFVPAFHILSGGNLLDSLKDGVVSSRGARRGMWNTLAISEMALSVVLCVGAGVLLASFIRLTRAPLGFDPENVLVVSTAYNLGSDANFARAVLFGEETRSRMAAIPGVRYAGIDFLAPFGGGGAAYPIGTDVDIAKPAKRPVVTVQFVGGDYFQALSVPLLSGRLFLPSDRTAASGVAIINNAAAQQYFDGMIPIGHAISLGSERYTVIGVVGDVRDGGFDVLPKAEVFVPIGDHGIWGQFSFVLKTDVSTERVAASARELVRSVDPDVPVVRIATLEQLLTGSLSDRRLKLMCFLAFSIVALAGLFALVSYSARERAYEIGIRMAMGAVRADILRMVVGGGLRLALLGTVVGLGSSFVLTRYLQGMLFGATGIDALTLCLVISVLLAVFLAASYLPARRATKQDPAITLRRQ